MSVLGPYVETVVVAFRTEYGSFPVPADDMKSIFDRDRTDVTVQDLTDLELCQYVLVSAMRRNEEMLKAVRRGKAYSILAPRATPNRQQRRHGQ
jgi:hypothetical protein